MSGTGEITIGRLSSSTNTHVEAIRYYERVGLLPAPARTSSGYRLYATAHVKRLGFIRRARALGFSVAEVRKLLMLADERRRPCSEVRVVAEARLEDVKQKIADLRRMQRVLIEAVARCRRDGGIRCPVIDSLDTEATACRIVSGARSR